MDASAERGRRSLSEVWRYACRRSGMGRASCRWRRRFDARLEFFEPGLDRGGAEAAVAAEAHVGDPAGPGLCPNPVGPHAQPFGDFLGGQQPVNGAQCADALMWI